MYDDNYKYNEVHIYEFYAFVDSLEYLEKKLFNGAFIF
jgi:hypothetical protein